MYKKFFVLCISIIMVFVFGACGNSNEQSNGVTSSLSKSEDVLTKEVDDNDSKLTKIKNKKDSDSSILIAYFSWSGNTKKLAEVIQEQVGGDLFEIQPKVPYTDDINELSGVALQEQNDNARPELSTQVEDINKYDVVFIGYPNWWNDMPMPVFTFLEKYDFSGKTVIPFSTYGDSGFGRSIESIEKILNESTMLDGLAVQEHELDSAPEKVSQWLKKIGVAQ